MLPCSGGHPHLLVANWERGFDHLRRVGIKEEEEVPCALPAGGEDGGCAVGHLGKNIYEFFVEK